MYCNSVYLTPDLEERLARHGAGKATAIRAALDRYTTRYLGGEASVLPLAKGEVGPQRGKPTSFALDRGLSERIKAVLEAEGRRLYPWKLPCMRGVVFAALEELLAEHGLT